MNVDDAIPGTGVGPPRVALRDASMDEAMSVGGLVFHRHTLRALDPTRPPRLDMVSYRSGPVTLGALSYSSGVRVDSGAIPNAYQINLVLEGAVRSGRGGEQMIATPQRAVQYGLHPHGFEGFESPARLLGVKIDRLALERRLEVLLGRDLGGAHIEFGLAFPFETPISRDWYTVVQLLARRLWSEPGLTDDSLVLSNLQDALLTGLLVASPHSFRDELSQPAGAAAPRAVQRALAYVDGSPEASCISVPELAAMVGVSVRALQSGFRSALGTTPLTFLHERRLSHARRELETGSPESTSVAEIADRWGFAHHGRFSSEYRRRFGESPSATLRRS